MSDADIERWIIPLPDGRKIEIDVIDRYYLMRLSRAGAMQWKTKKLSWRLGLCSLIKEGFIETTSPADSDLVVDVVLSARGRRLVVVMALQPENGEIEIEC